MLKDLKMLLAGVFLSLTLALTSCAPNGGTTLGDGQVDPVEAAVIQLSVGATMAAYPKTIVPAFQVTSAMLAMKTGSTSSIVELSGLDEILKAETAKLNLDPITLQSFNDLIVLVKASLNQQLANQGIALDDEKLVVAWKVVEIVNATAKARLFMLDKSLQ
jgi:hypothetical protein